MLNFNLEPNLQIAKDRDANSNLKNSHGMSEQFADKAIGQLPLAEFWLANYKYCERLRVLHKLNIRAIKLADGFDSSALRLDGQKGIEGFN